MGIKEHTHSRPRVGEKEHTEREGTENRKGEQRTDGGWDGGAETKEGKALVEGGGGGAMSVFKEDLKELREVHDGQNADSIRS